MYFYWKRLCIIIVIYVYLLLVYVFFLKLYCTACSITWKHVSLCYSCLCVVYVHVLLDAATLTEVFPCFFLSCKANARVNLAKTGHGPHSPKLLCCSMYCLFCVIVSIVCV